jgi:hypothetical protein
VDFVRAKSKRKKAMQGIDLRKKLEGKKKSRLEGGRFCWNVYLLCGKILLEHFCVQRFCCG